MTIIAILFSLASNSLISILFLNKKKDTHVEHINILRNIWRITNITLFALKGIKIMIIILIIELWIMISLCFFINEKYYDEIEEILLKFFDYIVKIHLKYKKTIVITSIITWILFRI